ncbi:hypothetical protein DHEL01_v201689 [Diaporthe helianthi]|uniref:Uncharacterized protein n=1 Tax=Diaporthe helianthi TaxID=158607 RepID=A0A2P5IBM5_DIAHE|nr:hypothetical protein DHEL01_v201689 [Diaporthe helianthi]
MNVRITAVGGENGDDRSIGSCKPTQSGDKTSKNTVCWPAGRSWLGAESRDSGVFEFMVMIMTSTSTSTSTSTKQQQRQPFAEVFILAGRVALAAQSSHLVHSSEGLRTSLVEADGSVWRLAVATRRYRRRERERERKAEASSRLGRDALCGMAAVDEGTPYCLSTGRQVGLPHVVCMHEEDGSACWVGLVEACTRSELESVRKGSYRPQYPAGWWLPWMNQAKLPPTPAIATCTCQRGCPKRYAKQPQSHTGATTHQRLIAPNAPKPEQNLSVAMLLAVGAQCVQMRLHPASYPSLWLASKPGYAHFVTSTRRWWSPIVPSTLSLLVPA